MKTNPSSGIVMRQSAHSVEKTVKRLQLFAIIDHSGEAQKRGINYAEYEGPGLRSPKDRYTDHACLAQCRDRSTLKILVSEDSSGDVWPSYNSTSYLQSRHGLPQELANKIAGVDALAKSGGEDELQNPEEVNPIDD